MVLCIACNTGGRNKPQVSKSASELALIKLKDLNSTQIKTTEELIKVRNRLLSFPADSPPSRELTRRLAILNKRATVLISEVFRAELEYQAALEEEARVSARPDPEIYASEPIVVLGGLEVYPYSISMDTNNGIRAVEGRVYNSTSNSLTDLTISFDSFDDNNQSVGELSDFIDNLGVTNKWEYKAIIIDTNVTRVEFKAITDVNGSILFSED